MRRIIITKKRKISIINIQKRKRILLNKIQSLKTESYSLLLYRVLDCIFRKNHFSQINFFLCICQYIRV